MQGTPNYRLETVLERSTYPFLRKLLLCVHADRYMTNTPEEHLRFAVDLDEVTNSYIIMHSPPPMVERESVRGQMTIKRLLKKFDEAIVESWSVAAALATSPSIIIPV